MSPPAVAVELPASRSSVGQEVPQQQVRFPSQRPYKYGMVMLCLGALINWLGLAENYIEPVRYIGVACIITGAILIIAAMCCWMNSNTPTPPQQETSGVHVIDIAEDESSTTKPPDYDSVITAPPSYDVAIKLDPAQLLTTNQPNVVLTSEPSIEPPPAYSATTQPHK